jgi:dipeptidyl aminopeptidase/acylaminoacyl peptidase
LTPINEIRSRIFKYQIVTGGQHATFSQVAMDDNGNAIITWYQSDGVNWQIFKS